MCCHKCDIKLWILYTSDFICPVNIFKQTRSFQMISIKPISAQKQNRSRIFPFCFLIIQKIRQYSLNRAGHFVISTALPVSVISFSRTIICIDKNRIVDMLRRNKLLIDLLFISLNEVPCYIDYFLGIAICSDDLQHLRISHFLFKLCKERYVGSTKRIN